MKEQRMEKMKQVDSCSLEEVAYAVGFYCANFVREVSDWFSGRRYVGGSWEEATAKDKLLRIAVLRMYLSEKEVELLKEPKFEDIGAYITFWEQVGEKIYEVVDSGDLPDNPGEPNYLGIEDLAFYCSECIRGIQGMITIGEAVGNSYNVTMWLKDSCGCFTHED